ncbi:hypothetical protein O6H91_02G065000 [Diphasiastrum complanatum]|nr:hypothetical protein O6H91_02G065000 [Diphasiastrum complanatum]
MAEASAKCYSSFAAAAAAASSSSSSTYPEEFLFDQKYEACSDILVRRLTYGSVTGALAALFFFRRPHSRWAAIAFGAGLGLGSAYTDCCRIFNGSIPGWGSKPWEASRYVPYSQSDSSPEKWVP